MTSEDIKHQLVIIIIIAFVIEKGLHNGNIQFFTVVDSNNLSQTLRHSDSTSSFKAALKTHLFNNYF